MIYLKCYEFADKRIMIVPRKNKWAVRCCGYKSQFYKGYVNVFGKDFYYDAYQGSLSECNDIFNREVSFVTKLYDENIYVIAEQFKSQDFEVIF